MDMEDVIASPNTSRYTRDDENGVSREEEEEYRPADGRAERRAYRRDEDDDCESTSDDYDDTDSSTSYRYSDEETETAITATTGATTTTTSSATRTTATSTSSRSIPERRQHQHRQRSRTASPDANRDFNREFQNQQQQQQKYSNRFVDPSRELRSSGGGGELNELQQAPHPRGGGNIIHATTSALKASLSSSSNQQSNAYNNGTSDKRALPTSARPLKASAANSSMLSAATATTATSSTSYADGMHDVSSLAIYLREKKLDEGLHDVKSVLRRLQSVLEEKQQRIVVLEDENFSQKEMIRDLNRQLDKLKRQYEHSKNAIERPLRQQLEVVSGELSAQGKDMTRLKKDLDDALWKGSDYKKRAEISANQAEDLRIGLEKLRADYDILIARANANEAQLTEFSKAREGIRGQHESQLAVMEMKYASLENQCHDLKTIRESLEEQLKEAQIKSNEHASLKNQHKMLMESAEIHRRSHENLVLEEQLHAAHVNNCRLMRLLMETDEFADLLEFNTASQSFDFIRKDEGLNGGGNTNGGGCNGGGTASKNTGILGADVIAGSYHDPHRYTTRSKNAYLNGLSQKHQHMHDAVDCENRYISSCLNGHGNRGGAGAGSGEGNAGGGNGALILHTNGGTQNNRHVHTASGVPAFWGAFPHPFYPATDSGGPLRPREIIDLKSESQYWIPHNAFIEAQKWRDEVVPSVGIKSFYTLFCRLNEVWRERMQQRLEVQGRTFGKKLKEMAEKHQQEQQHAVMLRGVRSVSNAGRELAKRRGMRASSAGGGVGGAGFNKMRNNAVISGRRSRLHSPSSYAIAVDALSMNADEGGGGGPSTAAVAMPLPPLPSSADLAALRRDVHSKAFSRVAIGLFQQYDALLLAACDRCLSVEEALRRVAQSNAREAMLRRPTEVVLYDRLGQSADAGRAVAGLLEDKLVGAAADVRRFLSVVEKTASDRGVQGNKKRKSSTRRKQKDRNDDDSDSDESSSSTMVPAALLTRVVEFMHDFTEEVTSQVERAATNLRCAADANDALLLHHKETVGRDEKVGKGLGLGYSAMVEGNRSGGGDFSDNKKSGRDKSRRSGALRNNYQRMRFEGGCSSDSTASDAADDASGTSEDDDDGEDTTLNRTPPCPSYTSSYRNSTRQSSSQGSKHRRDGSNTNQRPQQTIYDIATASKFVRGSGSIKTEKQTKQAAAAAHQFYVPDDDAVRYR